MNTLMEARRREGAEGTKPPPAFHFGEQGSKSAFVEMQWDPVLNIDMIQRRSNKLYKQTKYDWKREQFV